MTEAAAPRERLRLPTLSIRSTVLVAIVLGLLLPALLVLAVDGRLARAELEEAQQRNRGALLALAAAVVTEPAWTLSDSALRAAIERILHDPSVCAVEVLDLAPTTPPLQTSAIKCSDAQKVATLQAPIRHAGRDIARLRVAFDDSEVDAALARQRQVALWLVGLQVVVGVGVLTAVLSLRLLRPIGRLKTQARQLAAREALPAPTIRPGDELGELGGHLHEVHAQVRQLFAELEGKNAQLHRMAMHDHLTGLPNRTLLRELFAHASNEARREQQSLALLFIDLDHFKAVNDTLGHAAGDELLLALAQRLGATLRESDLLCRMGGDEFLVMLSKVDDAEQVAATAERLLRAFDTPVPLPGAAGSAQVTASLGIAMYPADGADFDALVRTADIAMYRSKELGRNRLSFYHADLDVALRSRLELERELQQAIAEQHFVLHWQAVVATPAGRIAGCEALLRWQHPRRGLLPPAAFIQAAEHTGLIVPIGMWVLDAACAQFAAWRRSGCAPQRVAVNVSALQLRDDALQLALPALLQRHGIGAGVLELELTESALLSGTEQALQHVAALRKAGARLVIDDFGTGYSSLAYLKRLKPDKLKIDRSFVCDLPAGGDDRALVEAIIGIARTLGIEVVAEGVETPAQREFLRALGCTLQQGYLHARPLPAAGFEALLHSAETAPIG